MARVTRQLGASSDRVFDAWLDPEKVRVWWRATAAAAGRGATETIENVTIDARVGGRFSILVRRNGRLIDHTGIYLEVDRPRRLVFTWAALEEAQSGDASQSSRVVIEIVPIATGCAVTLTHEMHPEWRDFVDRGAKAWSLMLEAIDETLAEVPSI